VAIESECFLDASLPHQDERNTVGEADILVGELLEEIA